MTDRPHRNSQSREPVQRSVCRHCHNTIAELYGYTGKEWWHVPDGAQQKAWQLCRGVRAEPEED